MRFNRTVDQFVVPQKKSEVVTLVCFHLMQQFVNTALCLLVAVISLTSYRSKTAMTQLHLEAQTFVIWSFWQARLTNQLYSY